MGARDLDIGVLLIGLFFNTYLFGLVTYQFAVYYGAKFNDHVWIKSVVGALFFIDVTHSAVAVYAAWDTCVTNYGNPASLAFVNWTIPFTAVATSVAAIISQIFLANRVLKLTQSKILFGAIVVLSFLGCIFGFIAGIRSGIVKEYRSHLIDFRHTDIPPSVRVAKLDTLAPQVTCWLTFQTAADILITASLTISLIRARTGLRSTNTMINRLIRGAVQTGFFVSLFALGDLFSFLFLSKTTLYAMFAFPIGRIYTNTLMDTLNARRHLRATGNTNDLESDSFQLSQSPSHTGAGIQFRVQKQATSNTVATTISATVPKDGKYVYK